MGIIFSILDLSKDHLTGRLLLMNSTKIRNIIATAAASAKKVSAIEGIIKTNLEHKTDRRQ